MNFGKKKVERRKCKPGCSSYHPRKKVGPTQLFFTRVITGTAKILSNGTPEVIDAAFIFRRLSCFFNDCILPSHLTCKTQKTTLVCLIFAKNKIDFCTDWMISDSKNRADCNLIFLSIWERSIRYIYRLSEKSYTGTQHYRCCVMNNN